MSSFDRALQALELFTSDKPFWTVDEAVEALGGSRSTVYRYFRSLTQFGLLDFVGGRAYTLGPQVIELDKILRRRDPLLQVVPAAVAKYRPDTALIMALHRMYRDRVVCTYVLCEDPDYEVLFQRGDRLPLFEQSSSLVLLASLGARRLKELYAGHADEAVHQGFAGGWEQLSARLRQVRRQGVSVNKDVAHRLAVPVRDADGTIIAALAQTLVGALSPAGLETEIARMKTISAHATELLAALEDEEIARAPAPRGRKTA